MTSIVSVTESVAEAPELSNDVAVTRCVPADRSVRAICVPTPISPSRSDVQRIPEEISPSRRSSAVAANVRSEEHTSELQSRENLVCRLLLEKKNNRKV